jgi:hypothetical protein
VVYGVQDSSGTQSRLRIEVEEPVQITDVKLYVVQN